MPPLHPFRVLSLRNFHSELVECQLDTTIPSVQYSLLSITTVHGNATCGRVLAVAKTVYVDLAGRMSGHDLAEFCILAQAVIFAADEVENLVIVKVLSSVLIQLMGYGQDVQRNLLFSSGDDVLLPCLDVYMFALAASVEEVLVYEEADIVRQCEQARLVFFALCHPGPSCRVS